MTEATPWSPQGNKDKFNLDDFAYLGSPNKRLPKGIDYDSFEGISAHNESPKRGKATDGSAWTPCLNLPGTPINVSSFMDCNSGFTPLLQQRGEPIPILNSGNIPSSNDWALYSNGTQGHYVTQTTTVDPFSSDLYSPPPRKGIRKKYEDNLLLSPSPGFLSGGSAPSDGGSFRVLDDLDSSSTGISLFNKTTVIASPKLGIAERHPENLPSSSPGLDSLYKAALIQVPPPPESPNGIREDQTDVKSRVNIKKKEKKEGGSSVKKEKKGRKKIESSPDDGLKIDTEDNVPPKIPQVTCSCKKTRCLKMYCDCFRFSKFCWEKCNCIKDGSEGSCCNLNTPECIIERDKAIKAITDRNPTAFNAKIVKSGSEKKEHLSGCHCKNSKCLKKYCECYTAMVPCSERCRCINCQNTIRNPDLKYEQPSHITAAYNEVEGVREQQADSSVPNSQSSMNSGVTAEPEELTPSMNMNRIDINKEILSFDSSEKICKESVGFPNDQSPPVKPNFEDEGKREVEPETTSAISSEVGIKENHNIMELQEIKQQGIIDSVAFEGVVEHEEENSDDHDKTVAEEQNTFETTVAEVTRADAVFEKEQYEESIEKQSKEITEKQEMEETVKEETPNTAESEADGDKEDAKGRKGKEKDKEKQKGDSKMSEKKKKDEIAKDENQPKRKTSPKERKKKTSGEEK